MKPCAIIRLSKSSGSLDKTEAQFYLKVTLALWEIEC